MSLPGPCPDPSCEPGPIAAPGQVTGPGAGVRPGFRAALGALAVTAAGSTLAGALVGLAWSGVAPRALLVTQGQGVAYVANAETSAFIVADAWFCLLTAAAGLICGLAGYLLAVRRYGPMAAGGLVLGGVAGSLLAMWTGQQQGLASFRIQLITSPAGTMLHDPLTLGSRSAIAFWPLFTGRVIGLIELAAQSRERRQALSGAAAGP